MREVDSLIVFILTEYSILLEDLEFKKTKFFKTLI